MMVEPFEVKRASTYSLDPLTQPSTCNAMLASYPSDRFSVGDNLADGRERHLDAEPLARHHVERQHAFSPTTRRALGQSDIQLNVSSRRNKTTTHTAAREP
jgi:hypothetical protein